MSTVLSRAIQGTGGTLAVGGTRGMGKSRLLQEAVREAVDRRMEVLHVRAGGLSALSLGYFFQELAEARSIAEFATNWSGWLHRHTPGEHGAPLLIAMDDVEWDNVGELTGHNAAPESLAGRPLVWVLSGGVDDDAQWARTGAAFAGRAVCCRLLPLPDAAVAELATDVLGMPPGPDVLDLCGHARGVPSLLTTILSGLGAAGVTAGPDGRARLTAAGAFPADVRSIAADRLDGLSSACRHVLDVASVLGLSFTMDELGAVLRQSALDLLPLIREAVAAGVLLATGARVAFKDVLIWQAVAGVIPPSVRAALLRDVGELLLEMGDCPADALRYLLRAVRSGDHRAVGRLVPAALAVQAADPSAAVELVTEALRLQAGDRVDRARLTATLADALIATGAPAAAGDALRTALVGLPSGDAAAGLKSRLAVVAVLAGDDDQARSAARCAAIQPDLPTRLRDRAVVMTIVTGVPAGRDVHPGLDDRAGRDSLTRMLTGEVTEIRSHARAGLATQAWEAGQIDESLRLLREDGFDGAGERHPYGLVAAQVLLVRHLISLRRMDEASDSLAGADFSAGSAREPGTEVRIAWTAPYAALTGLYHLGRGDVPAAEEDARRSVAVGDEHGIRMMHPVAQAVLAVTALRRGDVPAAAQQVAAFADRLTDGTLTVYTAVPAAWAALMVAEAENGAPAAVELFGRLVDRGHEPTGLLLHAPYAPAWLVRVAREAGREDLAERVVALAGTLAAANPGIPGPVVAAAHAGALLRRDLSGLAAAATDHLDPWSQGQAAEDWGVLLAEPDGRARRTDQRAGVLQLETAVERYTAAGAARDVARVRSHLRGLGVRRRHWRYADRPAVGWDSLTEAERAVAELVAQGLTNRQAARQMFLSHYTVNFHLRSVFRKLAINSRVELAHRIGTLRPSDTDSPS